MHVIEDFRQFHSQAGQFINVEEPSVIDIVRGRSEMGNTPVLFLNQIVQRLPAGGIALVALEAIQRNMERLAHVGVRLHELRELRLEVGCASYDLGSSGGEPRKRIAELFELCMTIAQYTPIMQWPDRQHMRLVGPYRQRPGGLVKLKSQFSTLKFHAILSAEQGYEHFLVQVTAIGVPFDVEPAGVYRLRTPFEDVEPQRIIGATDTHVIRDHIENLSEVLELQRSAHASERSVIAEFGIELRMIDNVIAVQTAGTCPQIGRCIQMTHTESRQIGRQGRRIIKTEMLMELQ